MVRLTRREFLCAGLSGLLFVSTKTEEKKIMTIGGLQNSSSLGKSLVHEHFLVDFIGAKEIHADRWNRTEVVTKVLPYLLEVRKAGIKSVYDCTPAFLGRDVHLLKMLAEQSGLNIVTNTGYYGARENKHLPSWALTETAEQLASRWVTEFENGIDQTSVKPGFIKIGVDAGDHLSETHEKLVRAAAITHLKTGLTIFSHTGAARTAFEENEILEREGVHPSAFVWVHAQAETDKSFQLKAARLGIWVSLDGIAWGGIDDYVESILRLKSENLLHRILISHDAGWYRPGEPNGEFKGYTAMFTELFPRLREKGFTEADFDQLLVRNPQEAMSLRIRKL